MKFFYYQFHKFYKCENFDPKSSFLEHTKKITKSWSKRGWGSTLMVSLTVKYLFFSTSLMNWTKTLPRSCYCPRHIKVLILAVNFTKLFKLGHDLSSLPFERQIKLRGKTGSAIFSITQPKISQMLPKTENTWELNIFQNGLLEQLKRNSKKLKSQTIPQNAVNLLPTHFQNQYQHLYNVVNI